jgi:tetratricopeptide (TPR) repeat protein
MNLENFSSATKHFRRQKDILWINWSIDFSLNKFFYAFVLFFFLIPVSTLFSDKKDNKFVYGFFDEEGNRFVKMIVIGETVSIEKASTVELDIKDDKSLLDFDTRPDVVIVKVLNNPGIRAGQILYLLEKHPDHDFYKDGNIVGQIKVISVFNTSFFGQQLRGEGHLRMIEDNVMTVAMPLTNEGLKEARIFKKQADYFVHKGDSASAIQYYKKSIQLDVNSPEPHFGLAKLHESKSEDYISAGYEYSQTYKRREKFLLEQEKYDFLVRYGKFLINKHKIEYSKNTGKKLDLDLALDVAKEAYKMEENHFENLYNLTEICFLNYVFYRSSENNLENRKKVEDFDLKTQKFLQQALEKKTQDYRIQSMAVFYYFEKLKDIPLKNLTSSQAQDAKTYVDNIENHSKFYMLYKPKGKKVDNAVLQASEYAKSLR